MPRIDPSRLLKCLTPLLDPSSGAIKSDKEVDKIYGLMSKFSKKLVSKCTYINILRASNADVLDLFMERGGWEMIHGWTVDATANKNHSLLNEIAALLIHTPASIQRLKENDLPRIIKTLSKDCEVDATKELAKKVVAKWICIAKQEDGSTATSLDSTSHRNLNNSASVTTISGSQPAPTQQTVLMYTSSGGQTVKADPCSLNHVDHQSVHLGQSSMMTETEHQAGQEFDNANFDIGNTDLNDISEFNPEVFDQHLEEFSSEGNNNSSSEQQQTSTFPPNIVAKPHPQTTTAPAPTSVIQTTPKITIKTVGGQTTVLNPLTTPTGDGAPYCLVTRDGKHFLMKLKLADQGSYQIVGTGGAGQQSQQVKLEDFSKQVQIDDNDNPLQVQLVSDSQSSSSLSETIASVASSMSPASSTPEAPVQKKRRPRKDPTLSVPATSSTVDGPPTVSPKRATPPNEKVKKADKNIIVEDHSNVAAKAIIPRKRPPSGANSKSVAAAAAAAKAAEEEAKLREKIKKEKQMMKQRQKDAKKQQQEVKDQETLKKLNLTSGITPHAPTPGSMKIPKIPKKVTNFSDAIGIPGSEDGGATVSDKTSRKKEKESPNGDSKVEKLTSPPLGDESRVKREEGDDESKKSKEPPLKERKHRVKVYNSKSSRADDLLKDMTENFNAKTSKGGGEKEKVVGSASPLAVSSAIKPMKRPSVEGITKPGDPKKVKLSDEKTEKEKYEKKKEEKAKEKEKIKQEKEKEKEREKAKVMNTIKESNLFMMDIMNASTESQKTTKKKRRLSSSGSFDKEKEVKIKPAATSPVKPTAEVKPITFNFYRDTLADVDDAEEAIESAMAAEVNDPSADSASEGAFTPQQDEGKLKSALCIHRVKSKSKKKTVRWREESELKETFYFEMDETERVNVTKQANVNANLTKDFTAMKQFEKAEERLTFRRKLVGDPMAEKLEWAKLIPVLLDDDTPLPQVNSEEKEIQESREKTILGLFLPPGSILPDTPSEADFNDFSEKEEPKIIPMEDVVGVTKVCDHRNVLWPLPRGVGFAFPHLNANIKNFDPEPPSTNILHNKFSLPQGLPPMPNVNFPPVQQPPPIVDFSNPWNTFSVPPTTVPPPTAGDMWSSHVGPENFVNAFANPNINVPPPSLAPFGGMNPFPGFDVPPMGQEGFNSNNFNNPQSQGMPNSQGNYSNGPHHGGPPNRDHHNFPHRGSHRGRGGGGRDFDRDRGGRDFGKDHRGGRRDHRDRNNFRDRDHRDDWERGPRDRDNKDHRDRDRNNRDRDRDHHNNRDYSNRDHERDTRPKSKGKSNVLCRYFQKGHCSNGVHCNFVHIIGGGGGTVNNSQYFGGHKGGSSTNQNSGYSEDFEMRNSRGAISPPGMMEVDGVPPLTQQVTFISTAASPPFTNSTPSSSRDEENSRFSLPPSSPTDGLYPPGTEPTKVIPIFNVDD